MTKIWVECHDLALNLCMSNLHSIDTNLFSVNLRAVASPFLWVTNDLSRCCDGGGCVRGGKKREIEQLIGHCCITQVNYMNFSEVRIECVGLGPTSVYDGRRWVDGEIISWTRENVYRHYPYIFSVYPMNRCNLAMWCIGLHFTCNFTNLNIYSRS